MNWLADARWKTTLETSEDENYTLNEWSWELHSKRVKIKTTLETSEGENYTRNEWRWKLHTKRVKMKTTLEKSEDENYTRNEWIWKLHSKRAKMWTTLRTSVKIRTLARADITIVVVGNKSDLKEQRQVITLEASEELKLHSKRVNI
jgi:hypothetical protein